MKKYKSSYLKCIVDRRWGQADLYIKCGFEILQNIEPRCFYFKNGDINRLNTYTKGYNLIYDSGYQELIFRI